METEQVIANRLWRIEWMRFRWRVEGLHLRRRMFGGYGYLYGTFRRGGVSESVISALSADVRDRE